MATAPACSPENYTGRDVLAFFHISCNSFIPEENQWERLSGLTTKTFNAGWETADVTADDIAGYSQAFMATFQNFGFSGEGFMKIAGSSAISKILSHMLNPVATGGQPTMWIRLVYPDKTYTYYSLIGTMDLDAPLDSATTFSLEVSPASSAYGVMIADTVPTEKPTGITITPASPTVGVGDVEQLSVTVTPPTANQNVVWLVNDTSIATIDEDGILTGVAAGTVRVLARHALDPTVYKETKATVTAP